MLIFHRRDEQSSVLVALNALTEKCKLLEVTNSEALKQCKDEVIEALEHNGLKRSRSRGLSIAGQGKSATNTHSVKDSPSELVRLLDKMRETGSIMATSLKILQSLRYPEMNLRQTEIRDACNGTFGWAFDQDKTSFKDWLENGNGVYWVNGKAGSGKSTLLKHICGHERTAELLRMWADGENVVIASHYFGTVGYSMQKRQEGLLQSLLFQILRTCPNLMPVAVPQRWDADVFFHTHPDPWTRQELSTAIENVLKHGSVDTHFCFFIDGLEEAVGDHYTLVKDLDRLAAINNVKLCVSSRPWNAFKAAYSGSQKSFTVQELTANDMRTFITTTLERDARFEDLILKDDRAHALVEDILERAQGVFLWVYLVVKSLRRGLTEADDIAMLQKRLDELPSDLEEFFRHILDSIDHIYDEYTSQALQLILEAPCPLPAILFWYLAMDIDDNKRLAAVDMAPFDPAGASEILENVALYVNKWCRDLLEISAVADSPMNPAHLSIVDFLHRTVQDFLVKDETQQFLQSKTRSGFNARRVLCQLLVAQSKKLNVDDPLWIDIFDDTVWIALHCARKEEDLHNGEDLSRYLFELDTVGAHYQEVRGQKAHWTSALLVTKHNGYKSFSGPSLLAYATNVGLYSPLRHAIEERSLDITEASNLLDCTLRPIFRQAVPFRTEVPNIEVVKLLLERGAKINRRMNNGDGVTCTVWELFLVECLTSRAETEFEGLTPLVRLLLHHGADPHLQVKPRARSNESSTVLQCLEKVCPVKDLPELRNAFALSRRPMTVWLSFLKITWPRK